VLVLAWVSPARAADTSPRVQHHTVRLNLSAKSLQTVSQLQARNLKTGQTFRPFADPPGNGCAPLVAGDLAWVYTNNVLTSVSATYQAQVVCTPTAAGQSMAGIVVTAQLWSNLTEVQEAGSKSCTDCLVSPVSTDIYACSGPVCAGTYWSANLFALALPAGWVWPTAPPGCIGLGTAPFTWIECSAVTDTVTISASD
jgi:hypothetical protein